MPHKTKFFFLRSLHLQRFTAMDNGGLSSKAVERGKMAKNENRLDKWGDGG